MFALFSFAAFFAGCSDDPAAVDSPVQNVSVEVDITAKPADRITRATDETQIKDLNVYLFGKNNTFKLHIYTHSRRSCCSNVPSGSTTYISLRISMPT